MHLSSHNNYNYNYNYNYDYNSFLASFSSQLFSYISFLASKITCTLSDADDVDIKWFPRYKCAVISKRFHKCFFAHILMNTLIKEDKFSRQSQVLTWITSQWVAWMIPRSTWVGWRWVLEHSNRKRLLKYENWFHQKRKSYIRNSFMPCFLLRI